MITLTDMHFQVTTALDGRADQYDVAGIVDEIHGKYGLIDIEDVDTAEFWEIVRKHAAQQDWFFTFGAGHPLFAKRYIKIHGTYESTREIMFSVFDDGWALQYDSANAAGAGIFDLTEIV